MGHKITALTALAAPASADLLAVVDADDLTQTKKITWDNLTKNIRLISANIGTPQAPTSDCVLQIAQVDGSIHRLILDTYSTTPCNVFQGRAARGTSAAPSALQDSDQIVEVSAHGYAATGYGASGRGHVRFEAAGNWTDISQPTKFIIDVTPAGSVTPVEAIRVGSNGWVSINQPTSVTMFHVKGVHVGAIGVAIFESTDHAYIGLQSAAGSEAGILFREGTTRYWQIKQIPATKNLEFATGSGSLGTILTVKANGKLTFPTSIDAAAVADEVSLGGYDISAGHRALAISSEEVVVVEVDETKFSHKYPVRINGATYNIMLCAT